MISKTVLADWRTRIQNAIKGRASNIEVLYGPVRDLVIEPVAYVSQLLNEYIRSVSLLVSIQNSDEFTEADAESFIANEGLKKFDGSDVSVNLTFYTLGIDSTGPDLVIPLGFPVGTYDGLATFITTETATLVAANASAYFNYTTGRYEIDVPAIALASTPIGPNRATRLLRSLYGFSGVTNVYSSSSPRPAETAQDMLSRYLLAIKGTDLSTRVGLEKWARNNYAEVYDVYVTNDVRPTPGAVDAYVIGELPITLSENATFVGINQEIALVNNPVVEVLSVVVGATTYTEGTDYSVSETGITFLPDDSVSPTPPTMGATVSVQYTYNSLIATLQIASSSDEVDVIGRDLTWHPATKIEIYLDSQLKINPLYNTTTVKNAVRTAVEDFVNSLKLGDPLEISDIQGVVRALSGVDNFIITRMVKLATDTGTVDLTFNNDQYPRLPTANFSITLI